MDKLDLNNTKEWTRVHKSSYTVFMCRPRIGTKVYNRLENAHYETNEKKRYVLSGTVGEKWVVDFGKLAKTYTFVDGSPITEEALNKMAEPGSGRVDWTKLKTRPDASPNWAFFLDINTVQNYEVKTDWAVLYANSPVSTHGKGDYLMCSDNGGAPNLNDKWVVNGEIFGKTYTDDFSSGEGKLVDVAPQPASIFG